MLFFIFFEKIEYNNVKSTKYAKYNIQITIFEK